METFELNDRVGSLLGKKPVFTGKVTGIFVGFLQVQYDKPVNNSMSTLIKPNGLRLISRAPAIFVATMKDSSMTIVGDRITITAPTLSMNANVLGNKEAPLVVQPEGVKDGTNEEKGKDLEE